MKVYAVVWWVHASHSKQVSSLKCSISSPKHSLAFLFTHISANASNYQENETRGTRWEMTCATEQSTPSRLFPSPHHPSFLSPSSCALKGPLNHSAWALWLVDLSAWLNSHFHHALHGRVTEKRGTWRGRDCHTDLNGDQALPPGIPPHWWWQTVGSEEETGGSECRMGEISDKI